MFVLKDLDQEPTKSLMDSKIFQNSFVTEQLKLKI